MTELVSWDHCIEAARKCSESMGCENCCIVNCIGMPTFTGILFFGTFFLVILIVTLVIGYKKERATSVRE